MRLAAVAGTDVSRLTTTSGPDAAAAAAALGCAALLGKRPPCAASPPARGSPVDGLLSLEDAPALLTDGGWRVATRTE